MGGGSTWKDSSHGLSTTLLTNLVYAANLTGSWMAGIQGYETSGGIKGCFGGHRAGVPAALEAATAAKKVADPLLGK